MASGGKVMSDAIDGGEQNKLYDKELVHLRFIGVTAEWPVSTKIESTFPLWIIFVFSIRNCFYDKTESSVFENAEHALF